MKHTRTNCLGQSLHIDYIWIKLMMQIGLYFHHTLHSLVSEDKSKTSLYLVYKKDANVWHRLRRLWTRQEVQPGRGSVCATGFTHFPHCSLLLLAVDKSVIGPGHAPASRCHAFYIIVSFDPLQPKHIMNSLLKVAFGHGVPTVTETKGMHISTTKQKP